MPPMLHLKRCIKAKRLEPPAFFKTVAFHVFQLHTVIKGEGPQIAPIHLTLGRTAQLLWHF